MDNAIAIPEWTAEQFRSTTEPFEWLYQYKDNKFFLAQSREQIKIMAGAVGVKNFVSLWNAYCEMMASKQGISLNNVTQFDGQEIELASGSYFCDDKGITAIDKMGYEVQVCNHPILPIMRLINVDTGEEKTEIAYKRGRIWRTMIVEKNTLSSSQKIVELSKFGVSVNSENSRELVKYFTELSDINYDAIPELNSVGRLGWIGDDFSPYVEDLRFDGDLCFKHMFDSVKPHGSAEEWLKAVRDIRANGIIGRIMLSASFASALIEHCNALPFFVHLWGGTESGKTVALMVAASIWANPAAGEYIHTFNATSVGQELTAGFVNSMPLILDELQVIKERKDFDNIIYMLSEGVGRSRGAKTGGLQQLKTWRNCIITSGEMPISNQNSGGGAVNRIIEVDCKDEKIFDNPIKLVDDIREHYGHGGRMFIDYLRKDDNMKAAIKLQKDYYSQLSSGLSTEKQALAASLILAADTLIEQWIFKDGQKITISEIEQFLTTKDQVSINERIYEWIFDFIAANPNKFANNIIAEVIGECWGLQDDDFIYINSSIFDRILKDSGQNPVAFLSWAKRKGHIECEEGRNTKRKIILSGSGTVRCVWLKLNKEEIPENESLFEDDKPFD